MNTYLGEKGLNETWQEPFKKTIKCHKCGGVARIMFVACENERGGKFVCDLHDNMKDKKYWVHDAMACAVYLCEDCFEPNAVINQA